MNLASLLLPDFTLILVGVLLVRLPIWGPDFWRGLENLVYFVLFPCLLFYATARAPLDFSATGSLLQVGLATCLAGIGLGWLAKPLFRPGPMLFESGVQTAFRFNSYIALAAASRLAGDAGAAKMALLIGFSIPLCNFAAVHALVHRNGGLLRELLRNPLMIATLTGVAVNLAGIAMPDFILASLSRIGNASIALGLITVGAGLRLSGLHQAKAMAGYFIAIRLLAMPVIAWLLGNYANLAPAQLQIAVLFGALPTASSAYVLATRMGGNGPFVAFLISAGTLLSVVTLPFWLAVLR